MGVGGGGGGLAKVIFLTKNPNLQKRIFVPFFFEGVGRGGGASLSDFLKRRKQILKKIGGVRRGGVG